MPSIGGMASKKAMETGMFVIWHDTADDQTFNGIVRLDLPTIVKPSIESFTVRGSSL